MQSFLKHGLRIEKVPSEESREGENRQRDSRQGESRSRNSLPINKQSTSNNYVTDSENMYRSQSGQYESEQAYDNEQNFDPNKVELLPEQNVYKILSDNIVQVKEDLQPLRNSNLPTDEPEVKLFSLGFVKFSVRRWRS